MDQPDQVRVRKKEKNWKSTKQAESYTYDEVLAAGGFVRCPSCEIIFQMVLWDCPSCGWTRP